MFNWLDFRTIDDYYSWLDTNPNARTYSFKIGVFNKSRFQSNAIGNFIEHFLPHPPENKFEPPVESVLGLLTHESLLIKTEAIVCEPEQNLNRQGDIFDFPFRSLPGGETAIGNASYRILVSHTCSSFNDFVCTVCPGYTAEEFKTSVSKLKNGGKETYLATVEQNKAARFFALGADEAWQSARLIFDLGQLYTISTEDLKKSKPLRSLTFPGNAYFSARLSMLLH